MASLPKPREPTVVDKQTEAYLRVGEAQAMWREAEKQRVGGYTVERIVKTEKGYEAFYTSKAPSLAEVHMGPYAEVPSGEYFLSELTLRKFWDPAYKQRLTTLKAGYARTPEERAHISQMRTQQVQIGATVAIVAFTAYDIGRSLYHIAKWKLPKTEDATLIAPELDEKPFSYTQFTGAKGARTSARLTYKPAAPRPETFKITPTRGIPSTPFSVTLAKVLKSKRAVTTLPQLLTWPSQTVQTKVPLGMYYPRFLTEAVFTGIAIGSFPQSLQKLQTKTTIRTMQITPAAKTILKPQVKRVQRLWTPQATMPKVMIKQFSSLELSQPQVMKSIQQTRVFQVQQVGLRQALRMEQVQLAKTVHVPKFPRVKFDTPKLPKMGKNLFGDWFRKQHKVKSPLEVAGTFGFGGGRRRRKGGVRLW